MKYTLEIEINLSRNQVIELFDNSENIKKWQPDLISLEHLSGDAGEIGAKSKLLYKMGRKEIEMIETITVKNLPDEFSFTYEAKGVFNIVENHFIEVNGNKTKWIFNSEFQCKGFMKIMAFLFPSAFKKESLKFMKQFKTFAENA